MTETLTSDELVALVRRVFVPRSTDTGLLFLLDLPDADTPDHEEWRARRALACEWTQALAAREAELGFATHLVCYPNVHTNNGDLPSGACFWSEAQPPGDATILRGRPVVPWSTLFAEHSLAIALTEMSATAPLKVMAKALGLRAATMPGFNAQMVPALRVDYGEVNRRVHFLKRLLDDAVRAEIVFAESTCEHALLLDLRFRTAHASGGLLDLPGTAGNLPSGEAYIVPYEGERTGEPSRSAGVLPVQFGDEVVRYRIVENRAVEVLSQGPHSMAEAALLAREPAYGNLAELGLGVLAAFGLKPIGAVLLDEKLGLHIAFGRSEHFGGQVGPAQFSSPMAVVHIDRVYVPEVQPQVCVRSLILRFADGRQLPLMQDGRYVVAFDES